MSIALVNFLLAQLKAMGHVTSRVTGDTIPYEVGVVGIALVILVYETRGGMRAVAWTDAVQGILMALGLTALLAWVIGEAGGLTAITLAVAEVLCRAAASETSAVPTMDQTAIPPSPDAARTNSSGARPATVRTTRDRAERPVRVQCSDVETRRVHRPQSRVCIGPARTAFGRARAVRWHASQSVARDRASAPLRSVCRVPAVRSRCRPCRGRSRGLS